ncbi:SpaH/EbpB family LPXTG-anchored major pilin [Frisingicoccus sp.]|uniref:SpaH/EbpB family LPXTG-anchored major pilin n=1 Tax=Frisingicoccus sp. TaxID=1918627 RepID=UPI003AB6BF68
MSMKKTKKLMSLLLALAMIFAMSLSVFAAGDNSIQVTNAQGGETYKIYKMLDVDVNPDKTAYSYTLPADSPWKNFFTGSGAAYVEIKNVDGTDYVTWKESGASDYEAFGKAAAAYAAATTGVTEAVAAQTPTADDSITFDGLDSGYYLITSTNGTLSMVETTPLKTQATVNEKNPNPTIDKKVKEDGALGTENSAQIGDTVEFEVKIDMKKGAKNYVMHDKMEDGLTFDKDSVQIDGLTKGSDYTVNTSGDSTGAPLDDCAFEIRFADSYLNNLTENITLTVTYNAVLNEKADITAGEKNEVQLKWGDNNYTEWRTTTTKTYQFEILKYDAADTSKNPLAGAEFQLLKADGTEVKVVKVTDTEYRVANGNETGAGVPIVTVANNKIVVKGVDLAEYQLEETKSPHGYAKLSAPKKFEVKEGQTVLVEVENTAGHTLPSTGGMGTTLFYVVGGILVIGAAAIFIFGKRTSVNK